MEKSIKYYIPGKGKIVINELIYTNYQVASTL